MDGTDEEREAAVMRLADRILFDCLSSAPLKENGTLQIGRDHIIRLARFYLSREVEALHKGMELGRMTAKAEAIDRLLELGDLCPTCRARFGE